MFSIPRNRKTLLFILAIGSPIAFSVWQALLNNFAVEIANFGGKEIGMLQSLREVPGFLAFTVVFLLLIIRQQNFAIVSLIILGIGTARTDWLFPFNFRSLHYNCNHVYWLPLLRNIAIFLKFAMVKQGRSTCVTG